MHVGCALGTQRISRILFPGIDNGLGGTKTEDLSRSHISRIGLGQGTPTWQCAPPTAHTQAAIVPSSR